MNKRTLLGLLLLSLSSGAFAGSGSFDAYYIPQSTIGDDGDDEDGDGWGAKAVVPLGPLFAATGEYQTVTIDDSSGSELDIPQWRVGGGLLFAAGNMVRVGPFVEYVSLTLDGSAPGDVDVTGWGINGRVTIDLSDMFQIYGQVGYDRMQADNPAGGDFDLNGFEGTIGGAVMFNHQFGGFIDYRTMNLSDEDNSDDDVDFNDLRVGVRLGFGA